MYATLSKATVIFTKLVLSSLTVCYLNLDHDNKINLSKLMNYTDKELKT